MSVEGIAMEAGLPAATFAIVPSSELSEIRRLIERVAAVVHRGLPASGSQELTARSSSHYDEPGPESIRKWFTPEELIERWGFGKTKVYEIPREELPYIKKGGLKRYFWAHVWAYEGRISWTKAEGIYAL